MVDFSARLKELREEYGLTQKELAGKIGAKRGTIAAWEAGRLPERQAVERLADFFGATTDYLLGRSDQRYRQDDAPSPADIEKILRESHIMFDGAPLDGEDKEDVIEFVKIALKAIKKRRKQQEKATEQNR
ncbi:MAG: helix-turn-helix domain-containing protein [Bacillota bacterium]|jgi:transcriptional regulator with XRE-family HTH domain